MAIVRPFRGIRYNDEKVLLKQVIAPPYDVITPAMRINLEHRSAYNVVNIDLPEGEDKYRKAAQTYEKWCEDGILITEPEAAFYVYEQEYEYNGRSYIRTGFVGVLKLDEFGNGVVYPHEKTLSGPKQDRYDLMMACKANLSQIFGLYLDPEDRLKNIFAESHQGIPVASAIDDDKVKHTIWPITNPKDIQEIQVFMKDKSIYIADGHHRYETALMYRDEMRRENQDDPSDSKPYDYVMMMFVNFFDPGLMIFPTHRVVDVPESFNPEDFARSLQGDFSVVKLADDEESADKFLADHSDPGTIVMVTTRGTYGLLLNQELLESLHPIYRNIDTYLLQKNILNDHLNIPDEQILAKEGIHFYLTQGEIRDYVATYGGVGFILKSASADTIRQISESGLVMPQKSTYFYPKLATGLLINDIE